MGRDLTVSVPIECVTVAVGRVLVQLEVPELLGYFCLAIHALFDVAIVLVE